VNNTPDDHFESTIEVPRRSNLWARLSAGQLTVEDIEGDKDINMLAGQLTIDVLHPELYGPRDASVMAGSLDLSAFDVNKGGLFRSYNENGPGKYRLHAHITTGEIELRGTQ
jgi:hypothetical protein